MKTMINTSAIDKIIAELAYKDYRVYNPICKNGKPKYKTYRPYTLSPDTNEARQIKIDYVNGTITENDYKSFCLRYNLMTRDKQ